VVIARPFAFLAPGLPLEAHFAAGQFIRDALEGRPLRIQGDGRPLRSYLYGTDLARWLWSLLLRGQPGRAYNVGSDRAVSIAELARIVAQAAGGLPVTTAQAPGAGPAPAYVPSVRRVREELGLVPTVPLEEAVRKSLAWYRGDGNA
jgi:nucleoside-diphosphate-sugar epimerase